MYDAYLVYVHLISDRSKAEMDLKELSETVQQQQGTQASLTSPKRQIRSRFQLNLDKTIESCKAQLGELNNNNVNNNNVTMSTFKRTSNSLGYIYQHIILIKLEIR